MRHLLFFVALGLWAQNEDAFARHAAAAAAALQSGDYALAERENREVLKLSPGLAEAEMNLGLSCYLQKKYEDAIQAFQTVLRLKPQLSNARLFLGISYFDRNEPAKGLPFLEKYSVERPGDLQGQYYLALAYLDLGREREAEQALQMAQRIDPRNVDVLYHLAQTYVGEARREPARREQLAREFSSVFAQIERIDPQSFRIAQLRAAFAESRGEKAQAMRELEGLLRNDPHTRGLHYTLGCLYMEAEQYSPALQQFLAELALANPEPRTYLQLGHTYIAANQPQQGLNYLRKAVTVTPGSAGMAWVDIGRAYRALDKPADAVAAFDKAIQLGERKASVYYQLGLAARRAGDTARSREALAMSQKLREDEKQPIDLHRN